MLACRAKCVLLAVFGASGLRRNGVGRHFESSFEEKQTLKRGIFSLERMLAFFFLFFPETLVRVQVPQVLVLVEY